jgi:hypothetical protein
LNGLPDKQAVTKFYRHDAHWSNRMTLGDSLSAMASLAEREGLRGKVQCIYLDPPYGIRFNSNFQWSTTSRDVKDGNRDHIRACRRIAMSPATPMTASFTNSPTRPPSGGISARRCWKT